MKVENGTNDSHASETSEEMPDVISQAESEVNIAFASLDVAEAMLGIAFHFPNKQELEDRAFEMKRRAFEIVFFHVDNIYMSLPDDVRNSQTP
jgi:hypothetical protein